MNNIYLVPNDDGTYEAFAAPVAPAENAALLVAEGEYPVECYYYRQDMNGDSILELSEYCNQHALIWGLNSHGLAFHTIRSLWDFDSHDGVTTEIGNIYDAARRKVTISKTDLAQSARKEHLNEHLYNFSGLASDPLCR